jgi:hypothetical protein
LVWDTSIIEDDHVAEQPYENACVIPHPREPRLLLLASDAGWALPRHAETEPAAIAAVMRQQLGLGVSVLRCAYDRARYEAEARAQVYALENHSPSWAPPAGAAWIGRDALRDLPLAVPEHRPVLDGWLTEAETGAVPELRAPWARPGWLAQATAWIHEQATRLGYTLTGPIMQVKVCPWSSVLRAPTASGALYFKTTDGSAAFEPAVTAALAELDREHSPRVLAIDAERVWMLMEDAGASLRHIMLAERDPARWEALLPAFARLQMATIPAAERLVALGAPDRRLDRLPREYASLIADPETLLAPQPGGLTEAELARARELLPELEAICAELASYGIPSAIQHDDLGPGNVLLGQHGGYVFFDWSDCSVAHPFLSIYIPLRWSRYLLEFDGPSLNRLRDAYLAPWTAYAPMERLLAAFPLACRLAKLSRALTWRGFVAGMEPDARWEYADSAPYFLRMFLNDDEGD